MYWVRSHVCMSHVPNTKSIHTKESCHAFEWVMSQILSQFAQGNRGLMNCMWHNSFICVDWLSMGDMTHSHVWHDSIYMLYDSFSYAPWLNNLWYDSFTYVACLNMWDVTRSHVWYDSIYVLHDSSTYATWLNKCVTWPIRKCNMAQSVCGTWLMHMCDMTQYMCDMTHSHVWHDSFTCVIWLNICVAWLFHLCDMTRYVCNITQYMGHMCDMTWCTTLSHVWHESVCVWYTHLCVQHDSIYGTWLIHMCNMTRCSTLSHAWHESICVWHESIRVWHYSFTRVTCLEMRVTKRVHTCDIT